MRLIDADLLKQCYTGKNSLGTNDNNSKADYASIRKMIDNQPTAYDVNDVLEKLDDAYQQSDRREGRCLKWMHEQKQLALLLVDAFRR